LARYPHFGYASTIKADERGHVWVATIDGQLYDFCNDTQYESHKIGQPLSAFCIMPDGYLWVGTQLGRVFRYEPQQRIVENFGRAKAKVRILVASDVASEGLNLHYMSHRMIHFDLPWSLMVFQQRNGRIDRYGQTQQPDIRYLVTETENEKIKGDMRLLEILIEKHEQAEKNIGDPATLLGKFAACEVHSSKGRADAVVETAEYVYIFEFKLDKSADEALAQIKEKEYALPYKADKRKLFEIGVNFASQSRSLQEWKVAE
jgi:superfamily II DNA/RNA helicase